jgi:hypothetical protein
LLAAWLAGCTTGVGAGTPTGLMLKSVLMAASSCRSKVKSNPPPIATMADRNQCFVRE